MTSPELTDEDGLFTDTAGIYADTPDIAWAIPFISFFGGLGLLTALPKVGKTQLVLAAIWAWHQGRLFLGRPVEFDVIVYMTEQGKATLREQLQRAGLSEDTPGIFWLRKMTVLHLVWEERVELVERLIRRRLSGKRVLVIVDTLGEWVAHGPGEENDAGAIRMGMEPLQHMAQETGAAVLAPLHAKLPSGEPSEAGTPMSPVRMVRGSTQQSGSADIITGLAKPPHRPGSRRIRRIASEGRVDGLIDEERSIVWTEDGDYEFLDPGEVLEIDHAQRQIANALGIQNGLTVDELVVLLRISVTTCRRAISDMGVLIVPTGTGVRNDPYRYWLQQG